MARVNLREVGETGLVAYSGLVSEAYTSQLEWPDAYDVYDEMRRRDPTIRTMWNALVLLANTASWYVEPGGEAEGDKQAVGFLESCLGDMSHTVETAVEDALSCVLMGWSWLEICYKRRDDGRVGWRKWAPRRQSSFERWEFDDTGGLKGMVQRPAPSYQEITLPIEKSLHFVGQRDMANPEGWPLLESIYETWYFVKNYQIIQGIGWQRSFVGLPVFEFEERPSVDDKSEVQTVGQALTVDEKQFVSVPAGVKFSLASADNRGAESLLNTIKYLRSLMLQTMLADFISLGAGSVGSFALGQDKSQLFLMAIDGWLDRLAEVVNRFAVPRLFGYNAFAGMTGLPRLRHSQVEKPSLGMLGDWLMKVQELLSWSATDEAWLRQRVGLPVSGITEGDEGSDVTDDVTEEDEGGLAELADPSEGRDEERGQMEGKLERAVGGFLRGQRGRVSEAAQAGRHDDDGFWEAEGEGFRRELLPKLTEALNELAGMATEDFRSQYAIELDWALVNADALKWAREYVGQLIEGVTDTTRANVRQAVANWIETGGELSDLVKALEPTFGKARARLIASTEVTRAYAEANDRLWQGSGLIEKWEWRTARDDLVCPICGPLHGERFELGKGHEMPAHPGCRCWKAPVVEVGG